MRDLDLHSLGQIGGDGGQLLTHPFGDVQRVGDRLLDDADRHGRLAVEADRDPLVQRTALDPPHIPQSHRIARHLLDDDGAELVRQPQVGLGQNRELGVPALDAPGRHLDVLRPQRVLDVLRRQIVGGEPRCIEPDAHGIAALAEDARLGDAGDRLEPVLDEAVGEIGDLE